MLKGSPEEIRVQVQDALRLADDRVGRRVRVHADGVHLVQGPVEYWYVPVLIDPAEKEMYRIYELLSDVEEALAKSATRVFLVPAALEFNLTTGSKNHG